MNLVTRRTAHLHRNPALRVERSITGDMKTPAHGSQEMPMWGSALSETHPRWGQAPGKEFARQRIRNLVDYIETLQVADDGSMAH